MAYFLNTAQDVREMLQAIGRGSIDDLFLTVPEEIRFNRKLDIPEALSELALTSHLSQLARSNHSCSDKPCFLGAGAYDHFVPAAVDMLASRGEFYTSYTPYQAEASQGTLQAIFEYQTLIAQLTGMAVSNASLYEGGSAVAEAVIMAMAVTGRSQRVVLSGALHPSYAAIVRTYTANLGLELVSLPVSDHGTTDQLSLKAALNPQTAAVVIQQPNFLGRLEEVEQLVDEAHAAGALAILCVDPISLAILKRPGDYGADIVVGEGQSLGNHLAFGGPYLGILACREEYVRRMPGRVVGQTVDRSGKRCWVLTLQTREQHIRRDKATSNICTNQGLMALRASIYLALLGPGGLKQVAELSLRKAHYAANQLQETAGLPLAYPGPFFKEFVVRTPVPAGEVLAEVERLGFHGGLALSQWYPDLQNLILIAVTEKRTKQEIDGLAEAYAKALAIIAG